MIRGASQRSRSGLDRGRVTSRLLDLDHQPPLRQGGEGRSDPTLEELQALARRVTGDETLTLTEPVWLTHSRFQHGVSAQYAKGRVLLVGDAGHRTLPAGGQGMNAGLHDAIGVAWRLAMVLEGKAEAILLDSYEVERGGEHRRLDKQQARRRAVSDGKGRAGTLPRRLRPERTLNRAGGRPGRAWASRPSRMTATASA